MDKSKIIKGVGIVAAGLALAGVGAIGGVSYTDNKYVNPALNQIKVLQQELSVKPKVITKTEVVTNEVPVEVIKEVVKEVEVPVDNGKLALFEEFVQNRWDEDLTVEYATFFLDAQMIGENYIKEQFVNLLKDEDYFDDGELLDQYRKSEVTVKTVYEPDFMYEDIEDKDVTLVYEVKLKAKEDGEDREYFNFIVEVPFEDGIFSEDDVDFNLMED